MKKISKVSLILNWVASGIAGFFVFVCLGLYFWDYQYTNDLIHKHPWVFTKMMANPYSEFIALACVLALVCIIGISLAILTVMTQYNIIALVQNAIQLPVMIWTLVSYIYMLRFFLFANSKSQLHQNMSIPPITLMIIIAGIGIVIILASAIVTVIKMINGKTANSSESMK